MQDEEDPVRPPTDWGERGRDDGGEDCKGGYTDEHYGGAETF